MPVVLKVQNDTTFLISIVIAIVVSLFYLFVLQFTSESASEEAPKLYALGVGIPMFFGMLYFLNVIPAVPLSLEHSGVYHSVVKQEAGSFIGAVEQDTRFFTSFRAPVYHVGENDKGVYFFSAVHAPAELTAPISHVWEYYDRSTKQWVTMTTIAFTLDGGREDGYRAYSQKENITEGLWRVTVKVDDKRIVGRMKFWVTRGEEEPATIEVKL